MLHVLTVVFIVLKLTGVIAWSWWTVLLPSILMLLPVLLMIVIGLGARILAAINKWNEKYD